MNNKLTDSKIQELITSHKDLDEKIFSLKKQIIELKNKNKTIMKTIHDNCNHNWVKDPNYYTYDERPNRCTKCNLVN
jgi:hypothetical protein